jgi:hypothetical protein
MAKMVATQTIHAGTKAGTVTIVKGQRLDAKDPVVKNAPDGWFVTAEDYAAMHEPVVHRAVEAATAAPGEARTVAKPAAKKPAAKKPAAKKKAAAK